MSLAPELSSMSTALEDLTRRIAEAATELEEAQRDDVAVALYEVERALTSAQRRLDQVVSILS